MADNSPYSVKSGGPGSVLEAIRREGGITRAQLVSATRLSRGTIGTRLGQLEAHNLVRTEGGRETARGRPAGFLTFNPEAGIVLAADLGAEHAEVGITDLSGRVLAVRSASIDAADGPERILAWLADQFTSLIREKVLAEAKTWGIGISVAAPVDHNTGKPMRPPIMPGWDGFDIPARLSSTFNAPVFVDKDANLMALAEQRLHFQNIRHLIFVKIATGIGSGIVLNGRVHHGVDGAAGDIGHVPVLSDTTTICRCGNVGCLEAVASGAAIAKRLNERGIRAANPSDVIDLVQSGNAEAITLVRESGKRIGEILVSAVNILNPELIIVGGEIGKAHEMLLASIRSVVYQRSLPLATRRLRLVSSRLDDKAGMIGAALIAIEKVMDPVNIDRMIAPC
jgi:predicted NBD/HSP70 family sugar kinase